MNNHMLKTFGIIALFVITTMAYAQDKTKRSFYMKDVQPIVVNGVVDGYSVFKAEKRELGSNKEYFLEYYDVKGALESSVTIVRDGYYRLLESSFNGELLCFKFFNLQTKELVLEFFDVDGEFLYDETIETTKGEKYILVGAASGTYPWIPTLIPVAGKGFVNNRVTREKRSTYFMTNYYANEGKELDWSVDSRENGAEINFVMPLAVIGDQLFSRNSDLFGLYDSGISIKEVETGKETAAVTFKESDLYRRITNVKELSNGQFAVSGYLLKGQKKKEKDQGIFKLIMDKSGKEISYGEYLYSKEQLEPDFIHLHDFQYDKVGNLIVIGEIIKLGGVSVYSPETVQGPKIRIQNMVVFKFDTNMELLDYTTIEKSQKKAGMPFGAEYFGNVTLGIIANEAEAFEFVYALNKGETIDIYYYNKVKRKGEKDSYVCYKMAYDGNGNVMSSVDLGSEAKQIKVLPANGKVIIAEYIKKEKRLHFSDREFK